MPVSNSFKAVVGKFQITLNIYYHQQDVMRVILYNNFMHSKILKLNIDD